MTQHALPMPSGTIPEWKLCDRLRKARVAANIDVQEMAEILGVHRNGPGNWEADRGAPPRAAYLRVWAQVTGVDLHWLIHGRPADVDPEPDQPAEAPTESTRQRKGARRVNGRCNSPLPVSFETMVAAA